MILAVKINQMAYFKKQTGNYGEDLATDFLQKKGYKILERNLTNHLGEIDILCEGPCKTRSVLAVFQKPNRAIVVVEVKTKSGKDFGEGFEMVNSFKRSKLLFLAKSLQTKYPDRTIRIDVVSINTDSQPPEIKHFENAVEEN
ncbi:MAG: hypothetical protein BWY43_00015 [candidate division WS2 bacterium ADurb.Bin280]|uniref:UPF0102 protein BWY43_00015 n=1 Tax=candidate division WS2 bacterium ADurb.Bin280 TaxID=1852829 RepID=A0A1V5SHH2_9BACT|nr:MAG: hypothetical protein BWY43_00015 [candidate division WS2 bacterium ADurb.Bin280]